MFINKSQTFTILLLVIFVFVVTPGAAFADITGLDPKLYQPDLRDASDSGGPVVAVLNYVIGFIGLIILGYAVIPLVTDHGLKLIRGKSSFRDPGLQSQLLGFLGGVVIILLGVTGKWFEVMMFIWKIAEKVLSKLAGN